MPPDRDQHRVRQGWVGLPRRDGATRAAAFLLLLVSGCARYVSQLPLADQPRPAAEGTGPVFQDGALADYGRTERLVTADVPVVDKGMSNLDKGTGKLDQGTGKLDRGAGKLDQGSALACAKLGTDIRTLTVLPSGWNLGPDGAPEADGPIPPGWRLTTEIEAVALVNAGTLVFATDTFMTQGCAVAGDGHPFIPPGMPQCSYTAGGCFDPALCSGNVTKATGGAGDWAFLLINPLVNGLCLQ